MSAKSGVMSRVVARASGPHVVCDEQPLGVIMSGKIEKRFTPTTLPTKDCLTCGRPFSWRKKWERAWDEIKFCSGRCRRAKETATTAKAAPVAIKVIRAPAKKKSQ